MYLNNCQKLSSYPVRFSTDIVNNNNIFFLPFFFGFVCFSVFFSFFCFLFLCVVCVFFCLKQKVYILIHIRLCGQVSDEKCFFDFKKQDNFFLGLLTFSRKSNFFYNNEILTFIAVLVFMLLSRKVLLTSRKDNRNC